MLLALWSPKGGSGTSVLAAATALVLARRGSARVADLAGDQAAILGLASGDGDGLADWLALGVEAPDDALERLTVAAAPGLGLLPAGGADLAAATPEAGAALGVLLRDAPAVTVADAGTLRAPAARALAEVADASFVVVRGCYLALRRAVRDDAVQHARGVVLVEEPGRALGAREVADVLGRPVVSTVTVRADIARLVDAGVLPARLPDALARPVRRLLAEAGLDDRRGRAA